MSDRFRKEYRSLSEADKLAMNALKDAASAMQSALEAYCQPGRETSIAMTNLETCVMWAIKGITG